MSAFVIFQALALFAGVCVVRGSRYNNDLFVIHEWAALNFTWDELHTYEDYKTSGRYIAENCLMAGINVDTAGNIYVTVPRWTSGVPGTLNKLNTEEQTQLNPSLTPYPSWEMQAEGKQGALQNTQSMTIDSQNQMWALEVGRKYFFSTTEPDTPGAAGFFIIDLNTNQVTSKYYFPEEVVSYSNSFLNDIVLDEANKMAYFTDAWGDGAIIAYDMQTQLSRRFSGPSTQADPDYAMVINGMNYGKHIFTTPSDGIAITSDSEPALFYCQVQGTTLYRLPTAILRDFSTSTEEINNAVQVLGTKEPSDGMKYLDGTLYWGALTTSTYYSMEVNATSTPDMITTAIQQTDFSPELLTWVDTFAVDLSESKSLMFVSNRLNLFTTGKMDFTGKDGANMHIMRIKVGSE